ncbi:MAG: sterol desaturase family protein [Myxococcota bacterium]|nr:sterol desaturase family protein [Myxococcota bacterium]MDW8361062.1 sterol desaturase family protein [Myxococcales bacterium]
MVGFALGLLYENAGEWLVHRYVLHGLGRRRGSFWSFHWHEHHRDARRNGFADPVYAQPPWRWHAASREALMLAGAALAHVPLLPVAPFFTAGVLFGIWQYWSRHRRAHLDPQWARTHLPWHYDHHMGPDQNANWCVSYPWFDHVMGTRRPYVGTERERGDRARRAWDGFERRASAATT